MGDWAFVTAHGDDHDDLPLLQLFEICAQVHSSLSSLPRDVDAAQHILQKCENVINSCVHRIDTAGVVSRNEELDDVPTDSIRRALLHFCNDVLRLDVLSGGHACLPSVPSVTACANPFTQHHTWLAGSS